MKYAPGGYSWLGVAPESEEELRIETLENQIHTLYKEYEINKDQKILSKIETLREQIKEIQENWISK